MRRQAARVAKSRMFPRLAGTHAGTGLREERRLRFREALAFLLAAGALVAAGQLLFLSEPRRPVADELRYIDYALNLLHHQRFGLSGGALAEPAAPGNANMPLYPAWVAALAAFDPDLRESLRCVLTQPEGGPCPLDLGLLTAAQGVLVLASLLFLWLTARRLCRSPVVAWLAAALGGWIPLAYANMALTENLIFPFFFAFSFFLVLAWQTGRARWWFAAGLAIGLATLTRPEYAYAFYALAVTAFAIAIGKRRKAFVLNAGVAVLGYALVVAPWAARNAHHFDSPALTQGYDGHILAQRVAYNRMSWEELGVAFLYWLPDFGDTLARHLFPEALYAKLGWEAGSYYRTVSTEVYRESLARAGTATKVVPDLIRVEILGNPVKHFFVTLPLLLRGIFVSTYWGLLGFLCFLVLLGSALRRHASSVAVAALPAWFMAFFYAAVSVSIPRYNLNLVPIYAIGMAWVLHEAGAQVWRRFLPRAA